MRRVPDNVTPCLAPQIVIQGKHAASVSERRVSGLRQLDGPAALAKERCSQLLLKSLHLQANRGWCPSQAVCRMRETANIVRSDESPQRVEIEIAKKHLLVTLHQLRPRSRINSRRGFGGHIPCTQSSRPLRNSHSYAALFSPAA
jgi:hypothetical protein